MSLSRRRFAVAGAAAFASIAVVRAPARAAQWSYRYASNLAIDHPLNVQMHQCWDAVRAATNGRLDVKVFANSELGGDTAVLTQLRSGAVQFFTLDGGILQSVVPVAAIQGIGFAFKNSADAFRAMDGALGDHVRSEINAKGIYVHRKMWENGMRQITSSTKPIRTAADLAGFTIRTPAGALWVDLFKSFGASPSAINFNETYTALQSKLVDGEENPYAIIDSAHLYEVQKYLSVTNHMWSAYHLLGNMDAWNALPPDVQHIVDLNLTKYALAQRVATAERNASLADQLARRGMVIANVGTASFRDKLSASGFYGRWKSAFGATAWDLLEAHAGKLS
jgi:tripartite ATP-independent transporter DctP family solute receptor